jgi:hypothetical protein
MDHQIPLVLQVVLYMASGAIIVLAFVIVQLLSRFDKRLDRVAKAVENLEAELTPLVREVRVVVDRLGDVSERAQEQWAAWEGASAGLLAPLVAINRTTGILRVGAAAFLKALWVGPRREKPNARAA